MVHPYTLFFTPIFDIKQRRPYIWFKCRLCNGSHCICVVLSLLKLQLVTVFICQLVGSKFSWRSWVEERRPEVGQSKQDIGTLEYCNEGLDIFKTAFDNFDTFGDLQSFAFCFSGIAVNCSDFPAWILEESLDYRRAEQFVRTVV